MKEMTILVPDYVSERDIYYKQEAVSSSIRFVHPFCPTKRGGVKMKEIEALLATSYNPTAEEALKTVGFSDKDIEELRSRVSKLEQESKRQCDRVIKMEEGISDDLK